MNITQEGLQMAHKKSYLEQVENITFLIRTVPEKNPPYILQRIFPQRD